MKLAEDQQVVNALKQILEHYDYLEYDEAWGCPNSLHVEVTNSDAERNRNVPIEIRDKLADATNRKYSAPFGGSDDPMSEKWESILLYEKGSEEISFSSNKAVCQCSSC